MPIDIAVLTLGIAVTNAYLVADTETKNAILIDPVDEGDRLVQAAADRGWTIRLIVATHAHFDHVLASARVKALTDAPFLIHREAAPHLASLPETGVRFTGQAFPEAAEPDRLLDDSETIDLDSIRLEALYTPGHAPGHLSLYLREQTIVFSGDSLFAATVGRTDLPGGSHATLMRSIFEKLVPLGDDVVVLPGHGERTTIGQERRTNRHLLAWQP